MKNNKLLILALIFALLNMGAVFIFFGVQKYPDSKEYIEVIHWFQGEISYVPIHRLLTPLGPLTAIPFEFFSEGAGLIAQNIFFYLVSSFLIFKIVELVYRDKKLAFLASIFFITATPVLEVGFSYMVDPGGWFFYLLSIFLTLIYFKTKSGKLIILNGFLSGMGFLIKEPGGLGVLFFTLMVLLNRDFKIKEKILKIFYFGLFFLIPITIVQILTFKYFHFTLLDLFYMNRPGLDVEREPTLLVALRHLGQLFRILGILWVFILMGAWREWKEKNYERIKIFLALLPSSFSFFLWSVGGGGRVVFIFAPLGILLAAYGCQKIKPLVMALIILVILPLNYLFVSVNQQIPFTEIIYNLLFSK